MAKAIALLSGMLIVLSASFCGHVPVPSVRSWWVERIGQMELKDHFLPEKCFQLHLDYGFVADATERERERSAVQVFGGVPFATRPILS